MDKWTAWFLAGLFAVAVAVPGIAVANCPGHTVSADSAPIATADSTKTPMTPAPETNTGG